MSDCDKLVVMISPILMAMLYAIGILILFASNGVVINKSEGVWIMIVIVSSISSLLLIVHIRAMRRMIYEEIQSEGGRI